jgi:hypothetical protein
MEKCLKIRVLTLIPCCYNLFHKEHPMALTLADCNAVYEALTKVVPFARVSLSTLGGAERASIMIALSLDARETWSCGIFENSRYMHIMIDTKDLQLEHFSGYGCGKMRAGKNKTLEQAIGKILAHVEKIKAGI